MSRKTLKAKCCTHLYFEHCLTAIIRSSAEEERQPAQLLKLIYYTIHSIHTFNFCCLTILLFKCEIPWKAEKGRNYSLADTDCN